MPYKFESDKIKIPRDYDRRVKVTPELIQEIKEAYRIGESLRSMARRLPLSRRAIQFILFPERLEENKKRRAERGGSKIYYEKDKHKESMRDHRQYKKKLDDRGLLDGTHKTNTANKR